LSLGGSVCAIIAALGAASAQNAGAEPPDGTKLPQINVRAPKPAAAKPRQTSTRRTNGPAVAVPAAPAAAQPAADLGVGNNAGSTVPPLQQAPSLGKTGTKLEDLPTSVQIINRDVINQQGDRTVQDSVQNASGVVQGGQDGLGYFDHFLIRGFNAQVYSDGFSEGDQLGGISHSLNGVQRIEILSGPGSALFGSGPPGGTINVVHYTPSSDFHYGASVQTGSFGTINSTGYVTGPTTIPGLNYRIDGTASHTDGFRDLKNSDYEIRPDFTYQVNNHTLEFSLDVRQLRATPDSYGIMYYKGSPLNVPIDSKYSTPWSYADQNYLRPTVTDKWFINDILTINNRFSYVYRELDAKRTGDSTSPTGTRVAVDPQTGGLEALGRQLRVQHDRDNSVDYQFEPVWKFATGPVTHTLLTGFEYVHEIVDTTRQTFDLPTITNALAPVPTETLSSILASNQTGCGRYQNQYTKNNVNHSCDDDHMVANYYSLYATDQIDVTDRLKVRAGVRQDWWNTALTPLGPTDGTGPGTPAGTLTNDGQPLISGQTLTRNDAPVSWNAGALYKLFPGVSPYFGVSKSYLTNFNSENVQTGIGAPESAFQYEAGIKFSLLNDRYVLNTAVFDVKRENVATATGLDTVVFDGLRTKGFDASLDAKVTDQWRVMANFTALHSVVSDSPDAPTTVGNHPQGVPAYMANLWSTYKFSIGGVSGFTAGVGARYRDKSYSDTTNVNSIPAYVVGDALLGYEADNWGISLNVKNFTNERYFVQANVAGAYVGEPLSAFVKAYIKY
jgi:iron complex outermembrane receptor protein